ncbi:MAG TPA: TrkA C-terminal domain-containing protein, partial [Longimicrobiaceae bacterium]|nr:TrkA C-terminal domain-containing protein [Longimicrobiaceae bacterium]
EADSPLAGRSIRESEVRGRTGASIIAILRGGGARPNPDPSQVVAAGDTLMVVGDREQVGRFRAMAKG